MQEFAIQYGAARSAVFVYTGAFTECEFATAKVQAIVNLALARGMLGRAKCGIMPMIFVCYDCNLNNCGNFAFNCARTLSGTSTTLGNSPRSFRL